MFQKIFHDVATFLDGVGIGVVISEGRQLSNSELGHIADVFQQPIPLSLLKYWQELGDGFQLHWENIEQISGTFSLSFVEDILNEHRWMQGQNDAKQIVQDEQICSEAKRRKKWIPIYGIGEGGHILCLDTTSIPSPVRYYDSSWEYHPRVWGSTMASSLEEFIGNWSRYCFSGGSMTNRGDDIEGAFDWLPSHFERKYDRGVA